MIKRTSRAGFALAAALALLPAAARAAGTDKTPAHAAKSGDAGFSLSIVSATQGNFGKLSIGVGYTGGGPYLDEKEVRREGLHASLSLAVEGQPDQFRQPDVREGQTLTVAGYRILVEKILPGAKGTVIVRLWPPEKPAEPRKSWLRFLGL